MECTASASADGARPQPADKIVEAFAGLTSLPHRHRDWLSHNGPAIHAAGKQLGATEVICIVAVTATPGAAAAGLVVTGDRLGIIGKRRTEWIPRPEITGASMNLPEHCLELDTEVGRRSWWNVEPAEAGPAIAHELSLNVEQVTIADGSPDRPVDQLVQAFAGLTTLPRGHQNWLSYNGPEIQAAGMQLGLTEDLIYVAVAGRQGSAFVGLVVTDARLGVIGRRGTKWIPRQEIIASSSNSVDQILEVDTQTRHVRWWEVQPDGAARAIAHYLALSPEQAKHLPRSSSPSRYGPITVGDTTATFLGGSFIGNQARRGPRPTVSLCDGTMVKITVTDEDTVIITAQDNVVARYEADDESLHVDQATTLGRDLSRGRLAGTAAATLLLGPLGLLTLAAGNPKRMQEAFALTVDDGVDYGAFALDDAAFGRRISKRRSNARAPKAQSQEGTPPGVPTESVSIVEKLERLATLKDNGAISEEEFAILKASLIPTHNSSGARNDGFS